MIVVKNIVKKSPKPIVLQWVWRFSFRRSSSTQPPEFEFPTLLFPYLHHFYSQWKIYGHLLEQHVIVGENSNNRIFIINCSVQDTKVEEIGANIFEVNILAVADGKHSGGFYAISARSGNTVPWELGGDQRVSNR